MKTQNFVAKYARAAGARSAVHTDRKRAHKNGYAKHKKLFG